MATICDLPNEILLEIMWLLVLCCRSMRRYTTYADRAREKELPPSEWGFLTVTQVCSSWRRLAISVPKLWSLIDLADEASASMCIERSRSLVPLHVVSTIPASGIPLHLPEPVALPALCSTGSVKQLQSLTLSRIDDIAMRQLIDTISATSMPHLKVLHLALNSNPRLETILNIEIGKETAPQLESLSLRALCPTLSPQSWNQLSSLNLSFSQFPPELETKIFLSAFGTPNCLEQLSLTNIDLRGSLHEGIIGRTDSYFPNLKLLSLCLCSKLPLLLSSIGPCTKLEETSLNYTQSHTDTHDNTIPTAFIQHLPLSRRNAPLKLAIETDRGFIKTVVKEISSTPAELSFSASRTGPVQALERTARTLGHLPVQQVSLADIFGPMEEHYRTFFNTFSEVEILDLPRGGTGTLPVLGSEALDPSHNSPSFCCPNLREIHITIPDSQEEKALPDLLACVSARAAKSTRVAEIEKLEIYHSESASQCVRTYLPDLEEIVKSVECHNSDDLHDTSYMIASDFLYHS